MKPCYWGSFLLLIVTGPGLAGCESSRAKPGDPPAETAPPEQAGQEADASAEDSAANSPKPENPGTASKPVGKLLAEAWHANFMQGKRIGYRHTEQRELVVGGESLVQTKVLEHQSVLRFGQWVHLDIKLKQLVEADGKLVSFEYEIPLEAEGSHASGTVKDGLLTLKFLNAKATAAQEIRLPAETLGFNGIETSLEKQPLQPGEERKISLLQLPPFPLLGEVKLVAEESELVQTRTGQVRLLRISEQLALPDGQLLTCYCWTDETGKILKYSIPQVQQETYLTTRQDAVNPSPGGTLDIGSDSLVKLPASPGNLHQALQVKYRFHLQGKDPQLNIIKLIPSGLSQEVVRDPAASGYRTVLVTVQAIRPQQPAKLTAAQIEPVAADLEPSGLIESKAPEIQALAAQAAGKLTESWEKAAAIEKFVHEYLTEKNYSQAFSSAAEVAKSRTGDCTEHAVLVAALCRAAGVPARAAFGLVYVPQSQALAFHMWNEVWTGDRWVPLDATLGEGGIGGGHVKFGDSSLAGASTLLTLLPVMQAVGLLEAEVLEVK